MQVERIWEWIGRDLLPIMARDYNEKMKGLIASGKHKEAQLAAVTFQTKVVGFVSIVLWAMVAIPARLIGLFS